MTKHAGLDVTVLRHLCGFPDEPQRFGNIVKQAHGRSAAEFFLSRSAPADSFLAALCRAARDGEDVITVIEAAEMPRYGTCGGRTAFAAGAEDAPTAGGG